MHGDKFDFSSVPSAQAGNPKTVSAGFLSKIWNMDNSTATKVLDQNIQLNSQGANNDWYRQLSTNDWMLQYKCISSQFFTDTFLVTASGVSTRGNNCDQICVSEKVFVEIYLMRSKGDFPDALYMFCKESGVPIYNIIYPAQDQTSRKVKNFCHQVGTRTPSEILKQSFMFLCSRNQLEQTSRVLAVP